MSKTIVDPVTLGTLRRAAGLTQQAFATRLGVSMSAVQRWENPRLSPVGMLPIMWAAVRNVLHLPEQAVYVPRAQPLDANDGTDRA